MLLDVPAVLLVVPLSDPFCIGNAAFDFKNRVGDLARGRVGERHARSEDRVRKAGRFAAEPPVLTDESGSEVRPVLCRVNGFALEFALGIGEQAGDIRLHRQGFVIELAGRESL